MIRFITIILIVGIGKIWLKFRGFSVGGWGLKYNLGVLVLAGGSGRFCVGYRVDFKTKKSLVPTWDTRV